MNPGSLPLKIVDRSLLKINKWLFSDSVVHASLIVPGVASGFNKVKVLSEVVTYVPFASKYTVSCGDMKNDSFQLLSALNWKLYVKISGMPG